MRHKIVVILIILVLLAVMLPTMPTNTAKAIMAPGLRCNWLNVPTYSMNENSIPDEYKEGSCGPASGSIIVSWWKGKGYSNFDWWIPSHIELYKRMHCNGYGLWWWPFSGTTMWWASSGWSSYASSCGYDFHTRYWAVNADVERAYWTGLERITQEIDRGEPLMVQFGKPYSGLPANHHWCVLNGYVIYPICNLMKVYVTDPAWGIGYWVDWEQVYEHSILVSIHPR